jgi:hypothetical protein
MVGSVPWLNTMKDNENRRLTTDVQKYLSVCENELVLKLMM